MRVSARVSLQVAGCARGVLVHVHAGERAKVGEHCCMCVRPVVQRWGCTFLGVQGGGFARGSLLLVVRKDMVAHVGVCVHVGVQRSGVHMGRAWMVVSACVSVCVCAHGCVKGFKQTWRARIGFCV